jgi:hypothetical protein
MLQDLFSPIAARITGSVLPLSACPHDLRKILAEEGFAAGEEQQSNGREHPKETIDVLESEFVLLLIDRTEAVSALGIAGRRDRAPHTRCDSIIME